MIQRTFIRNVQRPRLAYVTSWLIASGVAVTAVAVAASVGPLPADDWKIAGPFGGSATSIAVDPKDSKTILAGARNSLLFQSRDAGANWQMLSLPKRDFGEVTSLLIDPADSNHYLAGMIGTQHPGLFQSSDAGKTWTSVSDVSDVGVRALAASASDPTHFVAGTLRGVVMSTDSGKSWTTISDKENLEMQGITAVAIDPKDARIIYAGTTHLPWKTIDGGKTWESIHTGMIDDSDVFSIYIDPTMPDNVFASACSGIYSSANRGDQWKKLLGIPNTHRRTHVIREDPTEAGTIYAGTTLGLFKSPNRGGTWKVLNSDQVNALAFDPAQSKTMYLALEYQGVFKSEDSGASIHPSNLGFVNRRISAVAMSGGKLYSVETQAGETTGIFVSADQGDTWQQSQNVKGLEGVHLHTITGVPTEDRILLAASPRQIYKSIDAGANWKPLPIRLINIAAPKTPIKSTAASSSKRPIVARTTRSVKPVVTIREVSANEINGLYSMKSGTKDVLFAATDLGLLRSGDMGDRWILADLPGTTDAYDLFMPSVADGRLIARGAHSLYLSKDFGDHWNPMFFPKPASEVTALAISADASSPIFVGTRSGLYSTQDNGLSWRPVSGGIPASTVNSVIYSATEPTLAYAVEFGKVYQTTDGGVTWTTLPSSLSSLHIRQLWIPAKNTKRLYAITNDLGILFRNEGIIR